MRRVKLQSVTLMLKIETLSEMNLTCNVKIQIWSEALCVQR